MDLGPCLPEGPELLVKDSGVKRIVDSGKMDYSAQFVR
jgi:hypothetical protein